MRARRRDEQRTEPAPVLPHDLEAEESVLGAMLVSPEAVATVVDVLRPEAFHKRGHRLIYEAAADLAARGDSVDPVTVKDALTRRGTLEDAGGPLYLHHLQETVPTPASAAHYARIVRDHAERRRMIVGLGEVTERLSSGQDPESVRGDVLEVLGEAREDPQAGPPQDGPVPASELLRRDFPDRVEWAVEELWLAEAVGFLAGEPKTYKSWVLAEIALAVAAGVEAFGRYRPDTPGPVLLVQEESRTVDYVRRLRWLAAGHGLALDDLEQLHVWSQPGLLLDDPASLARLVADVTRLEPVLIGLDPLVRMHSADEDRAREMRPVLRALRRLQAEHGCGVAVVHHLAKARADNGAVRLGQRMRGTGDFHALVDSALYFESRRGVRQVAVDVEHREAPSPEPFTIRLDVDETAGHAVLTAEPGTVEDLAVLQVRPEVEAMLGEHPEGLTKRDLEEKIPKRAAAVREAVDRLHKEGRVVAAESRRPDKLGRSRKVMLWRLNSP